MGFHLILKLTLKGKKICDFYSNFAVSPNAILRKKTAKKPYKYLIQVIMQRSASFFLTNRTLKVH